MQSIRTPEGIKKGVEDLLSHIGNGADSKLDYYSAYSFLAHLFQVLLKGHDLAKNPEYGTAVTTPCDINLLFNDILPAIVIDSAKVGGYFFAVDHCFRALASLARLDHTMTPHILQLAKSLLDRDLIKREKLKRIVYDLGDLARLHTDPQTARVLFDLLLTFLHKEECTEYVVCALLNLASTSTDAQLTTDIRHTIEKMLVTENAVLSKAVCDGLVSATMNLPESKEYVLNLLLSVFKNNPSKEFIIAAGEGLVNLVRYAGYTGTDIKPTISALMEQLREESKDWDVKCAMHELWKKLQAVQPAGCLACPAEVLDRVILKSLADILKLDSERYHSRETVFEMIREVVSNHPESSKQIIQRLASTRMTSSVYTLLRDTLLLCSNEEVQSFTSVQSTTEDFLHQCLLVELQNTLYERRCVVKPATELNEIAIATAPVVMQGLNTQHSLFYSPQANEAEHREEQISLKPC